MANNFSNANYIYGENGVVIPDTSDLQETIQNEYKEALGADLSVEESTPQGRLIDVETTARANVLGFSAVVANTLVNISLATGTTLDAWASNFDIYRKPAVASYVLVTVTGLPNTVITAESEAIDVNGIIWRAESDITIPSTGTATGYFYCSQTGPIALGIGNLNTIVASSTIGIDGWETITNTTNATLGAEQESDFSLKQRVLNGIFNGTALFGNYKSALLKLDNVQDVFTYDNPEGSAKVIDNISIPAHSVFCCVSGGNSQEIANALYRIKSAGCGWSGNTTVTVHDETYNTNNTVKYYVPSVVPAKVNVAVRNSNLNVQNLEQTIRDIIINYFAGNYVNDGFNKLGIRPTLSPFTIATLLTSKINNLQIDDVKIGLVTPANHAVIEINKASVSGGITWAVINTDTFASQISASGTYTFSYDGSNWKLNNNNVELATYGITITGDPVNGDSLYVTFSTGGLSNNIIKLYCTETISISENNIQVSFNG